MGGKFKILHCDGYRNHVYNQVDGPARQTDGVRLSHHKLLLKRVRTDLVYGGLKIIYHAAPR